MLHSIKKSSASLLLTLLLSKAVLGIEVFHTAMSRETVQKDGISLSSSNNGKNASSTAITQKRKEITAEAIAAINETRHALIALDNGKKAEALKALEQVTGKLELLLARDPQLALAPTYVSAKTFEMVADLEKIKTIRKNAEDFLEDGQVQAARHLLKNLASETVVSVINIPLATYPSAIKQAVKLIDQGKFEEAKTVIQTELNRLVVVATVFPRPVIQAQDALKEAEKLAEKSGRTVEENKRLSTLLADTRKQLELVQALGYGTKENFKMLYSQLSDIEHKTSGNKYGIGFFDKIKSSFSNLFNSDQQVVSTANKPASTHVK
ncbi:MAG: YfdX family protein [Pseudomonadota bacterium]